MMTSILKSWRAVYSFGRRFTLFLSLGLVVTGEALLAAELRLSLPQAIDLALSKAGASQVKLAEALVEEAGAARANVRSALLPTIEGMVLQQERTANLEAMGLKPQGLFRPPAFVGPYGTFDARASAQQVLFDFSSIRRYQSAKASEAAVQTELESTRDKVAGQVARLYVDVLRAEAGIRTAKANMELARDLVDLANQQKNAGVGTRLEVTRAEARMAAARQREVQAELEFRQTRLRLLELIGADMSLELVPTDKLVFTPLETVDLDARISAALAARSDLRAQEERLRAARLNRSASKYRRLPSLVGYADYGTIGSSAGNTLATWTASATLVIPVFDGGSMEAEASQTDARLSQEEIKTSELRRQIELEVRLAMGALRLGEQQVAAAGENVRLAEGELEQASRRYKAGVGTNIEVAEAQAAVEQAREDQIAALFSHTLARINLEEVMGSIRSYGR